VYIFWSRCLSTLPPSSAVSHAPWVPVECRSILHFRTRLLPPISLSDLPTHPLSCASSNSTKFGDQEPPLGSQIEASQLILHTQFCYAMEISRVESDSDLSLALRAPGAMSSMPSTSQPEFESAPVSLLGYPLCFKRPRSSSSSSCTSPSKRLERESEPDTESRRAAVRAWGNLPLSVADPDVFEIMEKEKHRQVTKVIVTLLLICI
jgi:hypothetical protein